jgi:hypothetical protein
MAREYKTIYNRGINDVVSEENAPQGSAIESRNWVTKDDRVETTLGKIRKGTTEDVAGSVEQVFTYDFDYSSLRPDTYTNDYVQIKRVGTELQFYTDNGTTETWTTIGDQSSNTDLFSTDEEVFFDVYSSLAGTYIFACGTENGPYRISPYADPAVSADIAVDMYNETKNYRGKFFFDKSRTILSGRTIDKSGSYLSKIDPQSSNYTTVTGESLGSGNINDTLAQATGVRIIFSVVVDTGADGIFKGRPDGTFVDPNGDKVYPDDYNANGFKGYINYTTGTIVLEKESTPFGSCTVDYQYTDFTNGGVLDFTFSAPRVASEGDIIRHDEAGTSILTIIPYQGSYIVLKERGGYILSLSADDSTATNNVFSRSIGIKKDMAVATDIGILYMDFVNKPFLSVIKILDDTKIISQQRLSVEFDFEKFNYDDGKMYVFNNRVYIACKNTGSTSNDSIIVYDYRLGTVDVLSYRASSISAVRGKLFVGDSVTKNVYLIQNGFDDDGFNIENYWNGKQDTMGISNLKRLRHLRVKGRITPDASIKVLLGFDNSGYQHIGTINGDGTYVDKTGSYSYGSEVYGDSIYGGDSDETSQLGNTFYVDLKLNTPKFRTRSIRFEREGIGYACIHHTEDYDIRIYKGRMPSKYRTKQNVSLDGTQINQ